MKHISAYLDQMNKPILPAGNRKLQDKQWYWVDKTVLHRYGRKIGVYGLGVYSVLSSYTNSYTQISYPSHDTIAQIIGTDRRTVARKLKLLAKIGLIRIESTGKGHQYHLLELQVTENAEKGNPDAPIDEKKVPISNSGLPMQTAQVMRNAPIGNSDDTGSVHPVHTNNNNITRIINQNSVGFKFIDPLRFQPQTEEELLAVDIAKALNDFRNLSFYLYYSKKYPDSSRKVFEDIKGMAPENIRKPLALFNFLLMKHLKKNRKNSNK